MRIFNKRANYEYKLAGDKVEAGISLLGAEAKALRTGRGDISQAHVRILNGEAYLVNANIPAQGLAKYNPTRMRKLLLHRDEIISIATKMKQQKLTLVPISLYNKRRLIKVTLTLGKPKRKFEKKESIKRKDLERELQEALKSEARSAKF